VYGIEGRDDREGRLERLELGQLDSFEAAALLRAVDPALETAEVARSSAEYHARHASEFDGSRAQDRGT